MKIVVIGGTGLIGSKVVETLRAAGHEAVAASPQTGVNALTGEGLANALRGAQVVVDVANSPSFEDAAVLAFFETSTKHLLDAEAAAGVTHHVALSVVGAERNPNSGYLRAKLAQERAIQAGAIPYSILRATQFFEFVGRIADGNTEGTTVRLPAGMMQPIAAAEVSAAVAEAALQAPTRALHDVAGPEPIRMDELARRYLRAKRDPREVVTDPKARYFGGEVDDRSLVPTGPARLGTQRFDEWLAL